MSSQHDTKIGQIRVNLANKRGLCDQCYILEGGVRVELTSDESHNLVLLPIKLSSPKKQELAGIEPGAGRQDSNLHGIAFAASPYQD